MVGMREHSFHLIRGEGRPVGVDEVCRHDRASGISVKGIKITHIPKRIQLYFLLQRNRHSGTICWTTNHSGESALCILI